MILSCLCIKATAEEWATLTQNLRRCCLNYNRASFEMISMWETGGTIRKELLKRWWNDPSVATVTTEIILADTQTEPLCSHSSVRSAKLILSATAPCTETCLRSIFVQGRRPICPTT